MISFQSNKFVDSSVLVMCGKRLTALTQSGVLKPNPSPRDVLISVFAVKLGPDFH